MNNSVQPPDSAQHKVLVLDGAEAGHMDSSFVRFDLKYRELDAEAFGRILPDLVIIPLFGKGVDAIETLERLETLGYRGVVIVRGPQLPNRAIVERELSAMVPALTVRLTGPIS
jgi:hypothetical protein